MRAPLLNLFEAGGPVVALLIALSVLVLSTVLYKLWSFAVAGVGRHRDLHRALAAFEAGDRVAATAHLSRERSYLAPVLRMAQKPRADAARLDAEAQTRFAGLERGFRLLDMIAQIAPLLGLFGTVLGMITAFQALEAAGSQVDPSLLAGGIWVALLTTAVGLAVAMPTTLALSWFEARMDAERILTERALRTLLAVGPARVGDDG